MIEKLWKVRCPNTEAKRLRDGRKRGVEKE